MKFLVSYFVLGPVEIKYSLGFFPFRYYLIIWAGLISLKLSQGNLINNNSQKGNREVESYRTPKAVLAFII